MRSIAVVVVLAAAGCAERPTRSADLERRDGATTRAPSAAVPPPASAPSLAPVSDASDEALPVLPIPARAQALEAPPAGWCGETAIQEGLLHVGVWAPQRLINKAGKPTHPDLYATDIPVALSELGVRYSVYAGGRGFDAFARWVASAVDQGDPVLAGVKILPTAHPEWGLDHFVLVVGHGTRGLLVNTTWGSRTWVADTTTPGLSFKNAFYGIRLLGLTLPANALPARLSLLDENAKTVKLRVTCAGLRKGATYRLEERSARSETMAAWSEEVTAQAEVIRKDLTVEAALASRFQCVPVAR